MQQRFRRLALFVGAASLMGGGVLVVACGTDNGSTPVPTPSVEAGKDGAKPDTGTDDGSVSEGGTDAGADCARDPILRSNTAGFRCAFLGVIPDGGPLCKNDEICCNPNDKFADGGFAPAFCATEEAATAPDEVCKNKAAAAGSLFTTTAGATLGKAWECADKDACGGATPVCCMTSADPAMPVNVGNTLATDKNHPPACGVKRVFKEGGSRCRATCAAGEIKLCSMTDNTCGAGTTCTPFVDFTNFIDRGYCK